MKRGTIRHPKTDRFMHELNQSRPETLGRLTMLWDYAGDYAPDGKIGRYTDEQIARAMDWPEADAKKLIAALVKCGWIDKILKKDGRLVIHDWFDHCEEWVKKRLKRQGERRDGVETPSDHVSTPSRLPEPEAESPSQGLSPNPKPVSAASPVKTHSGTGTQTTSGSDSGKENSSITSGSGSNPLTPQTRTHAYQKWRIEASKLWAKQGTSNGQRLADDTSTTALFNDVIWPPAIVDGDGRTRFTHAIELIQQAAKREKPMAWLTTMINKLDSELVGAHGAAS